MRKQVAPTEITNQGYGGYYNQGYPPQESQPQGYYESNPQKYSGPPSLLGPKQPGAIVLGGRTDPNQGNGNQLKLEQPQAKPIQEKVVKEAAAVASTKLPVESETAYPTPHKPASLLSIFFNDPGKFEGTLN
jgi:hypothetical protein